MNKDVKENQHEHVRKQESGTVTVGKLFMLGSLIVFMAVNILKNSRVYFTGVSYWFAFGFAAAVFAIGAIKLYQARKIEQYMDKAIDSGKLILVEKKRFEEMLHQLDRLQAALTEYGMKIDRMESETQETLNKISKEI